MRILIEDCAPRRWHGEFERIRVDPAKLAANVAAMEAFVLPNEEKVAGAVRQVMEAHPPEAPVPA